MIGVVVPAHDEERLIGHCLRSLAAAAAHPALRGREVEVVVVLDSCSDGTADVVSRCGVTALEVTRRNVGDARATGARWLLARGAHWLAFTDADCEVSASWLVHQIALRCDVVCGTVAVNDWSEFGGPAGDMRQRFDATYSDRDGHRHVHGANLAMSAHAYRLCGGFASLSCGEDVELVGRLQALNLRVAWSAAPRVMTSARRISRTRGGFADALVKLHTATQVLAQQPSAAPAALDSGASLDAGISRPKDGSDWPGKAARTAWVQAAHPAAP